MTTNRVRTSPNIMAAERGPTSATMFDPNPDMLRQVLVCVLVLSLVVLIYGKHVQLARQDIPHLRAKRWEELPNVTFHFDCTSRAVGFYADLEFECMIFHMCDEDGRRIPHICGGDGTGFNQEYRICDWMTNFNCKDSENWYYLNELTYVTDPPKTAGKK
uniref:Chitin-binding type-2 domain-containing protein n=1 Tax=Strigamia maritima TaxID=126957 RepID=T1JAS0_STRMM